MELEPGHLAAGDRLDDHAPPDVVCRRHSDAMTTRTPEVVIKTTLLDGSQMPDLSHTLLSGHKFMR